jgi:hypothetical protein
MEATSIFFAVLQSRLSCRTGGGGDEYFFRKMNNDKVEVRSKSAKNGVRKKKYVKWFLYIFS